MLVDEHVADFAVPATRGSTMSLAALRGKIVVLYFYPKDNTPGCTTEGQEFTALHDAFVAAGAVVLGVSRDSLKSHENFKAKLGMPFDLLADCDEQLCQQFDVIKTKNMYGKQVLGIERSTFVIDRQGVLRQAWRGVKAPGHAEVVLAYVQSLAR